MTQQSQKMWNVILNILFLINKSGDNSLGEQLKRVYWSSWWRELGGEKKDKWHHPQTLLMLQVVTSLHLGS